MPSVNELPRDILPLVARRLGARNQARLAGTSRTWRRAVAEVSHPRLRVTVERLTEESRELRLGAASLVIAAFKLSRALRTGRRDRFGFSGSEERGLYAKRRGHLVIRYMWPDFAVISYDRPGRPWFDVQLTHLAIGPALQRMSDARTWNRRPDLVLVRAVRAGVTDGLRALRSAGWD